LASADAVTQRVGNGLPVDLRRVAAECGVKDVEFHALLLDGGLALGPDGFYIYVRADADSADELTKLFREDGTGRRLPATCAKTARFTIAHEIAHALLYDRSVFPPKHREKVDAKSLSGLEHTCNVVAAALMLPERVFETEFRDCDFLDPNVLVDIADRALVTKTTLVWRFGTFRRIAHPVGFISRVERPGGEWKFTATSLHYSLRGLFPALEECFVRDIVKNPAFALNGGSEDVVTGPILSRGRGLVFEFAVNPLFTSSGFLTARLLNA
jgi:hypothetical protein